MVPAVCATNEIVPTDVGIGYRYVVDGMENLVFTKSGG